MTTDLEPPAPLPIHSRWFKAPGHTSGAIFAAKLMQSAEPLGPLEQKMDAYEFFHQIVEPNCENALRPPYHLRLAWNAIVSLNTVPEFIVLHRLGYKTDVDRDLLYRETEEIQKNHGRGQKANAPRVLKFRSRRQGS